MKILVVTGASGGHIFPALGFLEEVKEKSPEAQLLLVIPEKNSGFTDCLSCRTRFISTTSVSAGFNKRSFRSYVNFIKGFIESISIINDFHPDVVVGFGSLVSVPTVILAWFFRVKTVIHEQNLVPGKANRFLAHFVDKVAVSFSESKNYFTSCQSKVVFTGNPLRKNVLCEIDKREAREFFGLHPEKITILISGGSQGSRNINNAVITTISKIKDDFSFQVVHLSGAKDFSAVEKSYESMDVNAKVLSFLKEMHYAYNAADFVIARGGSSSIFEIINFKLPAIIIPYPFAGNHQMANAQFLERNKVALLIPDDDLIFERLEQAMTDLLQSQDKVTSMKAGFDSLRVANSGALLYLEIVKLVEA